MSEEAIQKFLADTKRFTIALETTRSLGNNANEGDKKSQLDREEKASGLSFLGGMPYLPPDFVWPVDRQGAALLCLAQLDLSGLPAGPDQMPTQGLLTIFRSPAVLTMAAKDNKSFRLFYHAAFDRDKLKRQNPGGSILPAREIKARAAWTVSEDLQDLNQKLEMTEQSKTTLLQAVQKFNQDNLGRPGQQSRLFGADLAQLNEQKEICAFASGGITHTTQRAKDSHYSHLVDEAQNWILFGRFDELSLFETGLSAHGIAETRILIRRQDLADGLFERAWLISMAN